MSANKDIMVDIETLGIDGDAVILSIGACDVADVAHSFYREIDLESQRGRTIDTDTLQFWLKQGNIPAFGTGALAYVLQDFAGWLNSVSLGEETFIWCKGTDFDTAILANAYKNLTLTIPWKYHSPRDFRTLAKCFPNILAPEFLGRKHHALDDAIHQAKHLKLILDHTRQIPYAT